MAVSPALGQSQDPNDDPFYQVPTDRSSYAPGKIVRTRQFLSQINAPGSPSTQVLFWTTGNNGEASATVATVWAPAVARSPPSIFAYQFAEDGDNLDCNPSWAWVSNSGSKAQDAERVFQGPVVIPWALDQGYYVVSTDAEGPLSAWLVGRIEGQAVLDAIRATISNFSLSKTTTRVALYGYSGGGHTTAWASTLAASYASDLQIVGAAFGGTPIDLLATINTLNNKPASLLAGGGLFGLANGYPDLNTEFNRLLTTKGQQIAKDLRSRGNCTQGSTTSLDYNTLFTGGNIFANAKLTTVLNRENLLASGVPVPKFPRLQYHGSVDTVVPFAPEQTYVQQQCKSGADIRFVSFSEQDHAATGVLGLPGALNFVSQALAGTVAAATCGSSMSMALPGSSASIQLLGQSRDQLVQQAESQTGTTGWFW